jgi:hypothetical protein
MRKAFRELEENYRRQLHRRLDLDNINWITNGQEWEAIYQTIGHIVQPIRYGQSVNIGGGIIIPVTWYWDIVQRLEYSPAIAEAYKRHKKHLYHAAAKTSGMPINDGLMREMYHLALNQINQAQDGRPPARKYATDDLILTEDEKRRYQQAVTAARAAQGAQEGGPAAPIGGEGGSSSSAPA